MNAVEYGPLQEAGQLIGGLDYYKSTMSQLLYEREPDVEDTFTFKNRGEERLTDYIAIENLRTRFEDIRGRGWQPDELVYLATLLDKQGQRVFDDRYLEHLSKTELPPVDVTCDEETGDIAIKTTGPAVMATFWETVVMSEVNEAYFEGYVRAHGIDLKEIYDEGDRRLSEKIAVLQANPDIKFADFGTRRRFSLRWQRHVLERLAEECPDNLLGTSNVALARSLRQPPIGTFAHELPMIYAGLADARGEDIRASHNRMLEDWYDRYGEDLSTVLPDTFGTDFFFDDFTPEQAEKWRGSRHDSGDAIDYGEKMIKFYEDLGVDPTTKAITFSDGLNIDEIVLLQAHFKGRVGTLFGWGTTLTNDLGIKPLNIVMKATHVRTADSREADTVKLSDDPGKHTGPAEKIEEYEHEFRALGATALAA